MFAPIAKAIDDIMAGQIVDPPPPGLSIPPAMQPGIASAFTEDPIAPLKLIEQPTLIVGGGRDRQVARLDFLALSAAALRRPKRCGFADMNHVLVDVTDDADDLAAYNQPERALDPRPDRGRRGLHPRQRRAHRVEADAFDRSAATTPRPSTAAAPRRQVPRPGG